MTQIDEPNLDELDELQKECNIDEYGTTGENAYYIFKRFRKILATQIQEAKLKELEDFRNSWHTMIRQEVHQDLNDRIAQLRSTQ